MRNLFIAIMLGMGLLFTTAASAGEATCEGNFIEFAEKATEDYMVISGASLDAFADVIEDQLGIAKPAEITFVVVPMTIPEGDGETQYWFTAYKADNCLFGNGAGYVWKRIMFDALAAAVAADDKVVLLKGNPDADAGL